MNSIHISQRDLLSCSLWHIVRVCSFSLLSIRYPRPPSVVSGCRFGGGGNQEIQTYEKLPELPADAGLLSFWSGFCECGFFSADVMPDNARILIIYIPHTDRDHEEWVWETCCSPAHGASQHEEVNRTHSHSQSALSRAREFMRFLIFNARSSKLATKITPTGIIMNTGNILVLVF